MNFGEIIKGNKVIVIITALVIAIGISVPLGIKGYQGYSYGKYYKLGTSSLEKEKFDDAARYFNKALEYKRSKKDEINTKLVSIDDARKVKASYEEAIKLVDDKKYQEAISILKTISSKDTKYYKLAQAKIKECIDLYSTSNLDKAKEEAKNSNFQAAIKYLDDILSLNPDNTEVANLKIEYAKTLETIKDEAKKKAEAAAQNNNTTSTTPGTPASLPTGDTSSSVVAITGLVNGTTWANLNNGGIAAVKNDWIYFRASLDRDGMLYKMKFDGSQKTKVASYCVSYLTVLGQSIAFKDTVISNDSDMDSTNSIYSYTEGMTYGSLFASSGFKYTFLRNNINYYFGGDVYIDSDGFCASKRLFNGGGNYFEKDGWFYYVNFFKNNICKVPVDGGTAVPVSSTAVKGYNIYGSNIYYISMDDYKLYSMDLTGQGKNLVVDAQLSSINIYNGWIYYSNQGDGNKLYKIKLDGSSGTRLSSEACSHISVIGDWVFYTSGNSTIRIKNDGSGRQAL